MAWSSGTSQQLISVLNQCCLTMSFPTILHIIEALAEQSLEQARKIAKGPHSYNYDNVNITTSIFVEQTNNTPIKV